MTSSAVIIGSGGGIGGALADLFDSDDAVTVYRLGRSEAIRLDLTDENSIAKAAEELSALRVTPALVVVATGLLHRDGIGPEKSLRELDPEWMLENYRINAVGPALVAKHFLPLMPRNQRTVFAVLSARVGSISDNKLGGWYSYRASKAALNMLIRNLAIEWQRKSAEAIIVGLHPGTVETGLSAPFKGNPATERFTPAKAAEQLLNVLDRLNPAQSGQVFAFDGDLIAP